MRATAKTGGAAEGRAGAQNDLLVPASGRLADFRRSLSPRQSRAGAGSAGQPRRAYSGGRGWPWRGFTPTGYGTPLAEGKETREIDGRHYVLEYPIKADFALIKAHQGDRWGSTVYRKAARNFGPIMATAAKTTIVEVSQLVPLGSLDPERASLPRAFCSARLLLENLIAAKSA